MAHLVVIGADGRQSEHPLRALNTIGRHPEQHIQILDRVVSKQHALLTYANGAYWLQDMESRNGTWINGARIQGRTRLSPGDTITLGGTQVIFQDGQTETASVGHVTIHEAHEAQTAIRSRLEASLESSRRFMPEGQLEDERALRDDYEKLRVAFELNRALGTLVDPEQVMGRILEKAVELTGADRGVILIIDEAGVPQPRAARHREGSGENQGVELSQTILQEVMNEHHAVLSSDAMIDSRFAGSHSIIMQGIRSTMCVPLMADAQLLGMIHLDSKVASGVFTEKDLALLSTFGHQAALRLAHVRLSDQARRDALDKESLSRLLSPNVVDQVVNGEVALEKGGELRSVTVMFADIRGFTALSERKRPQELVSMLNEYFEIMADIVFQHEGTLDKFVGDEIMAIWGAPLSQADHASRAVAAALDMRQALEDYNRFRQARGEDPLRVGWGLNAGEAVAGYMGATRTLSYTVIGDTVNTAARLCSHAGPGEILVGDSIASVVGQSLRVEARDAARLKGKANPVPVYAVTRS